jgi:hypothetical protein
MEELYYIIKEEDYSQVRLTVNEFRGKEYLHLREYYIDFDEEWHPTPKGLAIELDVDSVRKLFSSVCDIMSQAESKEVIKEYFGDLINS